VNDRSLAERGRSVPCHTKMGVPSTIPTRRSDNNQADTDTCRRNRISRTGLAGGAQTLHVESDKSGTGLFLVDNGNSLLPSTGPYASHKELVRNGQLVLLSNK
jgi:hypothetical protein